MRNLQIVSFGSKFGVEPFVNGDAPNQALFDCRRIRNPYSIMGFKGLDGTDPDISEFVLGDVRAMTLVYNAVNKAVDLAAVPPRWKGDNTATLAFRCYGGRHRSVAIAEEVHRRLTNATFPATVEHLNLKGNL